MSRDDFEKRLCITYIDEATVYSFDSVVFHAVVSMTTSKQNYIENIEQQWIELRRNHNIPDGECLHFTDIKALLNPAYFTRAPKDRNPAMERAFCASQGVVDIDKLHAFYSDVIKIIRDNDFTVQATGRRFIKNQFFADKLIRKYNNGYWYPIFREHLDRMAYYLIDRSFKEHKTNLQTNPKAKFHNLFAKLRYDGDIELSTRNDFRNAFSHSISNGSDRFTAEAFKDSFDEVRFIDKSEIGYCVSCDDPACSARLINHAGNEILDFITIFVARHIGLDFHIEDLARYRNVAPETIRPGVEATLILKLGDKDPLAPLDAILPKLYSE